MNWKRGLLRIWVVLAFSWMVYEGIKTDLPDALLAYWHHYPTRAEFQARVDAVNEDVADHSAVFSCRLDHLMAGKRNGLSSCGNWKEPARPVGPPIYRDDAGQQINRFFWRGLVPPVAVPVIGGLLAIIFLAIGRWIATGFKPSN